MANAQTTTPNVAIVNSKRADPANVGAASHFSTPVNYTSVSALRAALTAANGTYYTSAKLDAMTVNDMIFALRNIADPKTIADYMTASAA
jgi:hypothetical protein